MLNEDVTFEEFRDLFNSLSEKNKQHVRNGLGDNLLTNMEQVKGVMAVMRLMKAEELISSQKTD